tara:strand:+ start:81 stop:329 length:249 start_codon:yes stop_codon:yes gene_type:complete
MIMDNDRYGAFVVANYGQNGFTFLVKGHVVIIVSDDGFAYHRFVIKNKFVKVKIGFIKVPENFWNSNLIKHTVIKDVVKIFI